MTSVDTLDAPPAADPPRKSRVAKVVLIIVCALLVAMWIYAFGFASKKAAYRVDDAAWRERAEQVCKKWEAERLELVDMESGYIENPTSEQMQQRADLVEKATDILQSELDEVMAVRPTSVRDQDLIDTHRSHWEILIQDRRDYIERLRRLELAPYRETLVGDGPVSNVIIDFTTVNEIRSCAPPGELGGDT
jgi:acetoin utilization deacetylase AcuC-like enzyme